MKITPGAEVEDTEAWEPTASDHGDVLYDIGRSPSVGRYMVARRRVLPGEQVFRDTPAVIGPDNSSVPLCTVCWRKVTGSFVCGDCGWPLCGDTCRHADTHRQECSFFRSRGAKVRVTCYGVPNSLYDAILPLRVLMLKISNPRTFRLVSLLMDHRDQQTEAKRRRYTRVADLIRNSWHFAGDFTEEEVLRVLGILAVNSFCVHDGVEDNTGLIGLYPWTSLMSHCCVPNVKIVTKADFSYECEAAVEIARGEELVTSYHHYYYHLLATHARRKHIADNWKFHCVCFRCQDPTELGTMVGAVVCAGCGAAAVVPSQPLEQAAPWHCRACGHAHAAASIHTMLTGIEAELEAVPCTRPDLLEAVLARVAGSLHENHHLVTDTERRLIDIYGVEKGFQYCSLDRRTVEEKVRHCDHLLGLAAVLSPGQSELRGNLLYHKSGALRHLLETSPGTKAEELGQVAALLEEVVTILGPIRRDSYEGQTGHKAAMELKKLREKYDL